MDTRMIGSVASIKRHLSLTSVVFAMEVGIAIVCLSLASAQTGLALEPQTSPPLKPAARPDKAKSKCVVPFTMSPTNHMLVEARINDKGPYHLIFDLGALSRS